MNQDLRNEIDTCDECLSLKANKEGIGCCQYHIDKQFEEVQE
jgi:hypothetical protein